MPGPLHTFIAQQTASKQPNKKTQFPSACHKGEESPQSFPDQVVPDLLDQNKEISLLRNNKPLGILKIRSNAAIQID